MVYTMPNVSRQLIYLLEQDKLDMQHYKYIGGIDKHQQQTELIYQIVQNFSH